MIELVNVSKVYGTGIGSRVVDRVSLSIEAGSFSAIVGSSGSGKTTLLNMMGTLDRPTSGEVYIDGQSVGSLGTRELSRIRNRKLGFVFQFHHLLSEFNVIDNVLMPKGIARSFVDRKYVRRAEELLEMVGLREKRKSRICDLSGGQQQRVAIARALISRPKIVLADEPTGSLDSMSSEEVFMLFRHINQRHKTTFVMVTHDERIAERSDRVIRMEDGRVNDKGDKWDE